MTGLLFCLHVKILLPSIFKSIEFWSSMSCILLDFDLTDINIIQVLGAFFDGEVQGYSFCPPKKYKPTKQAFRSTKNTHGIVWNSECLHYSELPNILPSKANATNSGKGTEKCKKLGKLVGKEVRNMEEHGCPKTRFLNNLLCICSSYQFRHKTTLHFAQCKANKLGNWTMGHLNV